ncbi:hypothetical protein REPUB_Repub09cG0107800 [Reevesia pubescens]
MGKEAKTLGKGKKAWKANISTEDIHDYFAKYMKDALYRGSLTSAPTKSLFFIDKSKDLSVKRKIEKKREKRNSKKKENEALKAKDVVLQDVPKDDSASGSSMAPLWGNEGQHNGKARQVSKQSIIPAVEVEPPRCSYNPSFESHQDSLAQAVAEEMQKVYKSEL